MTQWGRLGGVLVLGVASVTRTGAEDTAQAPFSLSRAEAQEQQRDRTAEADNAREIQQLVAVPCRRRLQNRKILQLVAEYSADDGWYTDQFRFASFFEAIDARLRALGMKTYSQEQIRKQIAAAEVDAYFKNDPDAALAASKRFGADYVLRGDIVAHGGANPVIGINQVSVEIRLSLMTNGGTQLSHVEAHGTRYAGQDLLGAANALVREQADRLVAQLYNDYCRQGAGR